MISFSSLDIQLDVKQVAQKLEEKVEQDPEETIEEEYDPLSAYKQSKKVRQIEDE